MAYDTNAPTAESNPHPHPADDGKGREESGGRDEDDADAEMLTTAKRIADGAMIKHSAAIFRIQRLESADPDDADACGYRIEGSMQHSRTGPQQTTPFQGEEPRNDPASLANALDQPTEASLVGHVIDVSAGEKNLGIDEVIAFIAAELKQPIHPGSLPDSSGTAQLLSIQLVRYYGAEPSPTAPTHPQGLTPKAMSQVLSYIERNLDQHISLADLSGVVGISRFHFIRRFKASTGTTPMAFLEQFRIGKAQTLIRSGGLSMATIAFAVGFLEHSHFCRRFRSNIGVTPTAFARQVNSAAAHG